KAGGPVLQPHRARQQNARPRHRTATCCCRDTVIAMLSLNFLQIIGGRLWNFRGSAPLYPLRNIIAHRIVLTLRSLSGPRVPTDLLERCSSLPLLFVSGRFATFLFREPARGSRP